MRFKLTTGEAADIAPGVLAEDGGDSVEDYPRVRTPTPRSLLAMCIAPSFTYVHTRTNENRACSINSTRATTRCAASPSTGAVGWCTWRTRTKECWC